MTRDEIARTLAGMLVVNQKDRQAIEEAIAIITDRDWRDPDVELPTGEEFVLALISGYGEYFTCERAPYIAEYDDDEGWFLRDTDPDEFKYWKVDAWMPVPEDPEEGRE